MHVIITGGAGFLGGKLAQALLARPTLMDGNGRPRTIERITLVDVVTSPLSDPRVTSIAGDLADPALVARVLAQGADSVFHLAAVPSGGAEADFDLGLRVNLDATRALLEACRAQREPAKFVYASTCAVFGGPLPDPVPDSQALWPQSSYGNQKSIGDASAAPGPSTVTGSSTDAS